MPSQPRPAYYTFTTTDGHQATLYVAPDDDPWQAATQYARASFASEAEIAALTAEMKDAPLTEPGSGG